MTKSEKKEEKITTESKKEDLQEQEETLEQKLKNTHEKLLRSMAEMENQRRRYEKEKQEALEFGGFYFARETLSLLDNIERAISSFKNDEKLKKNQDMNKVFDGIEVVKKDLITVFKKNHITEISSLNKKFDPNFHQAMLEIEDDNKEPGTVIQEIQKGYMMKNRLLRPSLVSVTKKTEKKDVKDNKKKEKK